MTNVTGWTELVAGNPIDSAFTMYNAAFGGWVIVILFIFFQLILYMKTKNSMLCWSIGTIFVSTIAFGIPGFVKPEALGFMFVILVIELAGIVYPWIFKK